MLLKIIFIVILLGSSSMEYFLLWQDPPFHGANHTNVMICLPPHPRLSIQVLLRYDHVPAIILGLGDMRQYCNYSGKNE